MSTKRKTSEKFVSILVINLYEKSDRRLAYELSSERAAQIEWSTMQNTFVCLRVCVRCEI